MNRVTDMVPTNQEIDNLGLLVPPVLGQASRIQVLVVDDDSPDAIAQIADELSVRVLRLVWTQRTSKPTVQIGLEALWMARRLLIADWFGRL